MQISEESKNTQICIQTAVIDEIGKNVIGHGSGIVNLSARDALMKEVDNSVKAAIKYAIMRVAPMLRTETHYSNIKMFDNDGNITDDIKKATDYIINTQIEAELVDEYLFNRRNGIIFNIKNVAPHSWITPHPYGCDYILYNLQQYHNKDIKYYDEIYERVREGSDLWKELQGQ